MRICCHILRFVPTLALPLLLSLALAAAGYAHRLVAQPQSPEIIALSGVYGASGWLCGEGGREGRAECAACLPLACGLPPRDAPPALRPAPGRDAGLGPHPAPPPPLPRPGGPAEARAPPRA